MSKQQELEIVDSDRLWRTLGAYVSTLARKRGHIHTIEEWLQFLGALPGTPKGAALFLSAGPEQAAAYAIWLRDRPGMPERLRRPEGLSNVPATRARELGRGRPARLAANTITFKLRALKRAYGWVVNEGMRPTNPFAEVRGMKKDARQKLPTEMIDPGLVPRVIAAGRNQLERAFLAVLFGGALRGPSEARLLRLSDLRLGGKCPAVELRQTKGGGEALQPISKEAAADLRLLRDARIAEGAGPEDYLFVTTYGPGRGHAPISESTVNRRFKRACGRAGVGIWATSHSARATTATMLLEKGLPLDHVQKFLRHSNISATQVYDKRRRNVEIATAEQVNFADLERRLRKSSRGGNGQSGRGQ